MPGQLKRRPFDPVWALYLKQYKEGQVVKVFCPKCTWSSEPHATRMRTHMQAHLDGDDNDCSELLQQRSSKKQKLLNESFDRALSNKEEEKALHWLALAAVFNGWSHNSLQSPHVKAWLQSLRPGYEAPKYPPFSKRKDDVLSPHCLRKEINRIYDMVKLDVEQRLSNSKHALVAVDFWEDHQKCPAQAPLTKGDGSCLFS